MSCIFELYAPIDGIYGMNSYTGSGSEVILCQDSGNTGSGVVMKLLLQESLVCVANQNKMMSKSPEDRACHVDIHDMLKCIVGRSIFHQVMLDCCQRWLCCVPVLSAQNHERTVGRFQWFQKVTSRQSRLWCLWGARATVHPAISCPGLKVRLASQWALQATPIN